MTIDAGVGMLGSLMVGNCPELCSDPADFEAYLRQYPQGSYAALAENWLKKLSAAPAHATNQSFPGVQT